MKLYYADNQNKTAGPVSVEELRVLIRAGAVKNDPQVMAVGGTGWLPLSSLPLDGASSPVGTPAGGDPMGKVMGASKNAVEGLKLFMVSPVAGLPTAFQTLGPRRAREAGFALGGMVAVCALFALHQILPTGGRQDATGYFLKQALVSVGPFACLLGACAGVRTLFKSAATFEQDVFISGACLVPGAIFFLGVGIFRLDNMSLVGALGLLAIGLMVLMLFSAFTRIYKIGEQQATFLAPVVVLLNIWLCRILLESTLNYN